MDRYMSMWPFVARAGMLSRMRLSRLILIAAGLVAAACTSPAEPSVVTRYVDVVKADPNAPVPSVPIRILPADSCPRAQALPQATSASALPRFPATITVTPTMAASATSLGSGTGVMFRDDNGGLLVVGYDDAYPRIRYPASPFGVVGGPPFRTTLCRYVSPLGPVDVGFIWNVVQDSTGRRFRVPGPSFTATVTTQDNRRLNVLVESRDPIGSLEDAMLTPRWILGMLTSLR
jgi:hypothetical protein